MVLVPIFAVSYLFAPLLSNPTGPTMALTLRPMMLLCLVAALQACGNGTEQGTGESQTGVPLIEPFRSYSSVDSVQLLLTAKALSWAEIENSSFAPGDRRPQFHVQVLEALSETSLGLPGRLRLEFLNNRLVRTMFIPVDSEAYRRRLFDAYPGLAGEQSLDVGPWTSLTIGEYLGALHVSWVDTRLRDEMRRWIRRYS